jgi:Kef-type K+ transport system membrane component KefB
VQTELLSLLVIATIAAVAPLIVDLPRSVRIPVVVVEILGGILVGPHVLDIVDPGEVITFLSDAGLGFLFFLAGMEIDFEGIRGLPARLGARGWAISFGLGLAIAGVLQATGFVLSTLLIGVALSTTAVGTLMPILKDAGELDTPLGKHMLAAGVAGEFGPILAISLLLSGASGPGFNAALLIAFTAFAVGLGVLALRARPGPIVRAVEHTLHSSGQFAVRLAILILVALLYLTSHFGLDVVLGAFAAGIVVGLATRAPQAEPVRARLEGIGFGFLIPIFFVVNGVNFDLPALFQSASSVLRLPVFLTLFLVVRGAPVLLLYRHAIPSRDRLPLALTSATGLPLIVAVTQIGLSEGRMLPQNAAALVGAGMVSVLVFPMLALQLRGRSLPVESSAVAQEGF